MRVISFTLLLALCLLLATSTEGGKKKSSKGKGCIKPTPTVVDETWLKDVGRKGFYIPMHSNCKNCKRDKGWGGAGRSFMQEICWVAEFNTKYGKFSLPFNCIYFRFEQQVCHLDTSVASNNKARRLGYDADIVTTMTDNSTFVAGVNCIRGIENFWWVFSTSEKLDESKEKEIKQHFKDLGLSTTKIAKDGNWKKSPIVFKKFTLKDKCPEGQQG